MEKPRHPGLVCMKRALGDSRFSPWLPRFLLDLRTAVYQLRKIGVSFQYKLIARVLTAVS